MDETFLTLLEMLYADIHLAIQKGMFPLFGKIPSDNQMPTPNP